MLTLFSRLLRDAEYFRAQISKLDGSDDLGPHIVSLVDRKVIAPTEIPKVASTNGNGSNGVTQESEARLHHQKSLLMATPLPRRKQKRLKVGTILEAVYKTLLILMRWSFLNFLSDASRHV